MSDAALVLRQTRFGLLSLTRNPRALVFTLLFPVVLLVLFNSVFAGGGDTTKVGDASIDSNAYITVGMLAYALMMTSFSTLAITLTTQRESGMLKRYRGTPMPAWTFIAALILRALALSAAMVVVFLAIGHFAYGVELQSQTLAGLIVYLLLGTATMCVLGVAITSIATTAESASTLAPFTAVILSFISGVFIPTETLPDWLVTVGKVFPLAHLAEGLQSTFVPGASAPGLSTGNVVVLAAWGVAGLVVAARAFRWERRGR